MLAHFGPNLQFPCPAWHLNQYNPDVCDASLRRSRPPSAAGRAAMGVGRTSTHLGKVFAHRLGGGAQVVAEGAGIAGLAGALPEEFAGHV
jgi:hypothetical protein